MRSCSVTTGRPKPGITPIVALSLAAGSDGKSVYVTRAFRTSAIDEPLDNGSFVLFDRAVDGTLTGAGCISETGDGGACTDATALNGPISVAVSAEGSSVYVGSALSSAIAVFDRAISAPTPPAPAPAPPPGAPGLCANGLDDDGDGLVDASDPQCTAGRGREAPKDNPILACTGRPLMLTDVLAVGRRVRLTGLADPTLAGKTVLLSARGRIVARTTVRPDGAFVATTRRPASRDVRFQARVGDLRSLARKLDRRTIYTRTTRAAGKVKMTGKVTARRRGRAIVELQIRRGCSKYRTVARARLRRDGRFTITIKAPSTTATIILRARIRLPGRGTTYSSPRTITPA